MISTLFVVNEKGRHEINSFMHTYHLAYSPWVVVYGMPYWVGLVESDLLAGGAGVIVLPQQLSVRKMEEIFTISEAGYDRNISGCNSALIKRLRQKTVLLNAGIQTAGMTNREIAVAYQQLEAKINGVRDGRA